MKVGFTSNANKQIVNKNNILKSNNLNKDFKLNASDEFKNNTKSKKLKKLALPAFCLSLIALFSLLKNKKLLFVNKKVLNNSLDELQKLQNVSREQMEFTESLLSKISDLQEQTANMLEELRRI